MQVIDEYDDINEAIFALQWGGDNGELYAYAIYDSRNAALYLPDDSSDGLTGPVDVEQLRKPFGLAPNAPLTIAGRFSRYVPDC